MIKGKELVKIFLIFSFVLILSGLILKARGNLLQWTITINISPTAIAFLPADPDLEPVVRANTSVQVLIDTWPPNRRWQLFIRAEGNLVSADGYFIPINNISWQAAPKPPFNDGVLVAGRDLILVNEARGRQVGQLVFLFQNSWDYVAGEYNQTVTFTAFLL